MTPRSAIHARRDEGVVDVADGENAGVEADCARRQPAGIALAVEPFVVIVDELLRRDVEAAELAQQLDAPLGVSLDHGELVLSQRGRLLQDPLGHRQLADVVQEPTDRERPQVSGWKTELLADLHRAERNAARVLLGRLVLFCEPLQQRMHPSVEERLLFRHELRGTEVADERARLNRAVEVDGDCDSDDRDARQLEAVSEPPAEISEGQEQRRWQGGRQPGDPDDHREVHGPLRQEVRLQRPQDEHRVERDADDEGDDRRSARRRRDGGHEARHCHADDAEPDHADQRNALQDEEGADSLGSPERGQSRECEDGAADGQRCRPGQRDHAVVPDHDARRGKTVDGEQRGHHRERRAHEHDPAVLASHSDQCQRERGEGCNEGADSHADEVRARPEVVRVVVREEVQGDPGDDSSDPEQGEILDHAIARNWPHR